MLGGLKVFAIVNILLVLFLFLADSFLPDNVFSFRGTALELIVLLGAGHCVYNLDVALLLLQLLLFR